MIEYSYSDYHVKANGLKSLGASILQLMLLVPLAIWIAALISRR
jgi:hypothetical protein